MNKIFNYIIVFLVVSIIGVLIYAFTNNNHVSKENISLNESSITLNEGEISLLKVTINLAENNMNVIWKSSDEKVATVDQNGVVTAKEEGESIVTVQSSNGLSAECKVIVKKKEVDVKPILTPPTGEAINVNEVKLNSTSLIISKGQTQTFSIKATDSACLISVSSSNSSIVTVSPSGNNDCNGEKCFFDAEVGKEHEITYMVEALSPGTAYINVDLIDCTRYSDDKEFTSFGKIGVLIS